MSNLQPYQDPTGQMTAEQINAEDIKAIMQQLNNGTDASSIPRRSLHPGQISLLAYQVDPFKLHVTTTLAAGAFSQAVVNFGNNGLTSASGQTFLPVFYIDLFVDPPDTSSIAALYAGGYIYPGGANVNVNMAKLNFSWYLRNSTPGDPDDVVSYVVIINNEDASAHTYWVVIKMLLPADGNLNPGGDAAYLP